VDNAFHRINHNLADSVVCFVSTYPLDSDLSCRDFIRVISGRAAGFHRRAKLFELNFFVRKTFL